MQSEVAQIITDAAWAVARKRISLDGYVAPMAFLFSSKTKETAMVPSMGMGKDELAVALREVTRVTGSDLVVMIDECWMAVQTADMPAPAGPVEDMPGAIEAVLLAYVWDGGPVMQQLAKISRDAAGAPSLGDVESLGHGSNRFLDGIFNRIELH